MNSRKKISLLCAASTAVFVWGSPSVNAQNAETAADEAEARQDEIIVQGIRGSLGRALDTKRESFGFVDAISAEDVGKLPDQNVAEALQRVAGVSISRSRGEGEFVSIRGLGPNFVRGTVNGRTLVSTTETYDGVRSGGFSVSTGREANFDILPAEIISSLEVTKSASASDVDGGIGGVVNVRTHRPLDLGQTFALSAKGTYRELNEKFDPSASGLVSWVNPAGDFGLLGSLSYSERNIREDNGDSFGFATFGPAFDIDADGFADVSNVSVPFSYNPIVVTEKRERITAQGTLEWRPSSTDTLVVDALYSKRDLEGLSVWSLIGSCCGFFGATPGNGVTNPDGSIQVPGASLAGNVATGYDFTTSVSNTNSDEQSIDDDFYSVALNYERQLADWNLSGDLAYSVANGDLEFDSISTAFVGSLPFRYSVQGGRANFELLPGGADLSDVALYETRNANAIDRSNEDREFAAAFDVARDVSDSGIASDIRFGARYRTRKKDREDATSFSVNADQLSLAGFDPEGVFTLQDFLDGDSSFPFGQFLHFDRGAREAFILANNPGAEFGSQFSAPQSYGIKEDTIAAYAQLDIDSAIGNVPVVGNVGVRVVQTREEITGFVQPFRIDNDPSRDNLGTLVVLDPNISEDVTKSNYTNILPSMNLRFEVADDLFIRVAAGKTVTRPTFSELAPGLSGINPTQRFANSGNPGLRAYESLNVDLGVEWYYDDVSALYGSIFTKDIDEFIGVSTSFDVERFGVPFNSLSQPLNQGSADISGVELGWQHSFDWGLGFVGNLTLIESSAEFTSGENAGSTIPFQGVSDLSYNLTAFYERGGFSSRLAYSYRDDFVLLASDVFGNTLMTDSFGQLDGSVSYSVNDRVSVFANAINLSDEEVIVFSDTRREPVSYSKVGRRFEAGVKLRF